MKQPDELIAHLTEVHGIKPWDIAGARAAQEEHHDRLHILQRKAVDHDHVGDEGGSDGAT